MKNLHITTQNQNRMFDKKAKLEGSGKGPKSTDGGKDLGRGATNSLGRHMYNKVYSPSADANNHNKQPKSGNYC
jgi:hypothetical protein